MEDISELHEKWVSMIETQMIPLLHGDNDELISIQRDRITDVCLLTKNTREISILDLDFQSGISGLLFLLLSKHSKVYTTSGYPKTFEYLNLCFPNRICKIDGSGYKGSCKFDIINSKTPIDSVLLGHLKRGGYLISPSRFDEYSRYGLVRRSETIYNKPRTRIAFYTSDVNSVLAESYAFFTGPEQFHEEARRKGFFVKTDDDFSEFDFAIRYRGSNTIAADISTGDAIYVRASNERTEVWDLLNENEIDDKTKYISYVNEKLSEGMSESIEYSFNTNMVIRNINHSKSEEIRRSLNEIDDIKLALFFTFQKYAGVFYVLPPLYKVNELINKIYYVNLDRRIDRRVQIEAELKKMDIIAERFPAIEEKHGSIGCAKSHIAILKMAKEKGYENVLVLEDDFQFLVSKSELEQDLNDFFNSFANFDVAMVAYNLLKFIPEFSRIVGKLLCGQTTAAYICSNKFYDKLLHVWEEGLKKLIETEDDKLYSCDQSWKSIQPESAWYYFKRRIGRQRKSYSDIECRVTDYGA
jgi:glycosyl transferase, family 25